MRTTPTLPSGLLTVAQMLDRYRRAFADFSEAELLLLDGVVLGQEPEG